jgi:hypothetical protein
MTTTNNTLFNVPPIAHSDESNEWYTPSKYVEAAREVMGGIDLDPASCTKANWTIKANMYYKQDEDGLAQPWWGRIWLNPPFGNAPNGKSNMAIWSARLIEEYTRCRVNQAILLCMSNTEATWFEPLWAYPICFPCPRVLFHRPNGKLDHHIQGTCFMYLGPNEVKFIEVFSQFGTVAKRVSPPPAKPQTLDLWHNPTTLANEISSWDAPAAPAREEGTA